MRIFILIVIFVFGCATKRQMTDSRQVYFDRDLSFQLLDLWKSDKEIVFKQHVEGGYDSHNYGFDIITQMTPHRLKIIGLTGFGIRIFTIEYDGKKITFEQVDSSKNSQRILPQYIIADMQLIYYPLAEIKKNFHGKVEIKESKNQRIFYRNNHPIIRIDYGSGPTLKREIHYHNLLRNYHYTIRNLE